MSFQRETEQAARESWVWTDPTAVNANKRAFNGNWIPVIGAFVFVAGICLATLIN